MQFGLSGQDRLWYLIIDVLLTSVVLYFVLRVLNTPKGMRYVGLLAAVLVVLIASAFIFLPGVHLAAKALLVILVVGLPVLFHQEWYTALNGEGGNTQPGKLSPFLLAISAVGLAAALVLLGTGGANKIGELPEGVVISAVNVPEGTSVRFGSQSTVAVILSAPRDQWSSISAEAFSAKVDVANQGEGTYDLPLEVSSNLKDVRIIRLKPTRVFVSVEPVIRKTVPVVVKFSGQASEGLVPDEPSLSPDKVEVAGPKSVINDLTQAVARIKLNGEKESFEQKTSLVAETSSGEAITSVKFEPAEVTVSAKLVTAGKIKTVGIRPVITGQPASGYWVKNITLDPSTATVTGTAEALSALQEVTTSSINVSGMSTDAEQEATISYPSGITSATGSEKVKVKIQLARLDTVKTIQPEISYKGLEASLKVASLTPASVSVVVSGTAEALGSLSSSQVKLSLDLSAYKSAGKYSVTIKNADFTMPEGISLVSFLPSAIDVTLEEK